MHFLVLKARDQFMVQHRYQFTPFLLGGEVQEVEQFEVLVEGVGGEPGLEAGVAGEQADDQLHVAQVEVLSALVALDVRK